MSHQGHARTRGSRLPRANRRGNGDPKMIGQWKIGKTIGKGSSGRVKVARHVKTNQYAAVKIVSKNALINSRMSISDAPAHAEKVLLGIEREIVIMKLIDHPNVLNLYDVWETGNELYLIIEYVEGGELFDYLVSRGRLPVDEALRYFQQIISAVSYCHGFNIAHRDLKPENLLLSKSGSTRIIKVADFGMAAYTDPTAMLSTSCGSPHYASPEVVEGKEYKGNISDIWSCGVILYALLVGRLPFDDENLPILLEKVKMAKFEMPLDIPASAQDLLARMLDKNVNRRIAMPQILRHPFFLANSPSPPLPIDVQTLTLNQLSSSIDKPVQSEGEIDADIFDNLRTLWHGVPAVRIIEGLLNEEKTWEKAVYHLLLKYRSKHLESYHTGGYEDDLEKQLVGQNHQGLASNVVEVSLPAEESPALSSDNTSERTEEPVRGGEREDEADDLALCARPRAPTPQRAARNSGAMILKVPEIIHRQTCSPAQEPLICTDTNTFIAIPRSGSKIPNLEPGPQSLPLSPVSPDEAAWQKISSIVQDSTPVDGAILGTPCSSPMFELPGIDIPNFQDVDEAVKRFFNQMAERFNTMQRQVQISTASPNFVPDAGSHETPNFRDDPKSRSRDAVKSTDQKDSYGAPTQSVTRALAIEESSPDDSRFEDAVEEPATLSPHAADPTIFGLELSDRDAQLRPTRPAPQLSGHASGRGYKRSMRKNKKDVALTTNKENLRVRKDENQLDGGLHKKSSLRNTQDGRQALGNRHVQIVLPREEADEVTIKKKKSILSTRSAETSPALPGGPLEESGPRRSWFGNLFLFKPASYSLLSVYDAYTTRDACARLLGAFGVVVLISPETAAVLKCKLAEFRDAAGVLPAIRFRVELHHVTHAHSIAGYVTLLTMVQEKGALSSFKLVYNRLRREWDLDGPAHRAPHFNASPVERPWHM